MITLDPWQLILIILSAGGLGTILGLFAAAFCFACAEQDSQHWMGRGE